MKQNMVTLLGIAFVVAIVATGLFYGLVVMKLDKSTEAKQPMVVVAARDLKAGEVLTPADVKLAPRVADGSLVEGFSFQSEVESLTLLQPVHAGEVISREMLVTRDSAGGAALGVKPGYRAVSVHVADSSGVVNILQPGHRVDAQLVEGRGRRDGVVVLRTVLQNLEVLRVEEKREGSPGGVAKPVVTLLAYPEEADVLGVADSAAEIRLLLRHPLDEEITEREKVTVGGAMDQPAAQATPRQPVSRRTTTTGPGAPGQAVVSAENRTAGAP